MFGMRWLDAALAGQSRLDATTVVISFSKIRRRADLDQSAVEPAHSK